MAVLHSTRGGEGTRVLLLVHGLGATSAVWLPMLETVDRHWSGSWIAPDLRGHGRSPHMSGYFLDDLAGDMSDTIEGAGLSGGEITIVGHSLGGVIGLVLASGTSAIKPARVFGLGIKVQWSEAEIEGMNRRAQSTVKRWTDRSEALEFYRKAAGLVSVESDSPLLSDGVVEDEAGWRLAADPRTFEVGPPPMRDLVARARCPYHLACGSRDPLVSPEQLQEYDPSAEAFSGFGHNVMVENPDVVWDWVSRKTG